MGTVSVAMPKRGFFTFLKVFPGNETALGLQKASLAFVLNGQSSLRLTPWKTSSII